MDEKPPRAWLWYFIGMWVLMCIALIMLGTGAAHAQEPTKCAPLSTMIEDLGTKFGERIIWEGTMPTPSGAPVAAMLFQSPRGSWTMAAVQGTNACLMAVGMDGTPIETGKGV